MPLDIAPLQNVSERLEQKERVLSTKAGEVRVKVSRYNAWREDREFVLTQYLLADRKVEEEKGNLSFVFGGELFLLTCPLFYKLPHVQECVAAALHRQGLGVTAAQLEVTVGDHVMEEGESLQQLDVGAGSVLRVELQGATLRRGTARMCEVVLRNRANVKAFVEKVRSSKLYNARQLTVHIGDGARCESYTPLPALLALLGDMALPHLEMLTVVLNVLSVEEDWTSCFAAECLPALKELRVYQHEEEAKEEAVADDVADNVADDVADNVEDDVSPVLSDAESVLTEAQPEVAESHKKFTETINGVTFAFSACTPGKGQCVVTIEARSGEYAQFFVPGDNDLQFSIEHKQKHYKTSVPRDATMKELWKRAAQVRAVCSAEQ